MPEHSTWSPVPQCLYGSLLGETGHSISRFGHRRHRGFCSMRRRCRRARRARGKGLATRGRKSWGLSVSSTSTKSQRSSNPSSDSPACPSKVSVGPLFTSRSPLEFRSSHEGPLTYKTGMEYRALRLFLKRFLLGASSGDASMLGGDNASIISVHQICTIFVHGSEGTYRGVGTLLARYTVLAFVDRFSHHWLIQSKIMKRIT